MKECMKKYAFLRSIRFQLVAGVVFIVLPFCINFLYNDVYTINIIRNQTANSNKKMISLYMNVLDNQLKNVGVYMADNIYNSSDFNELQYFLDNTERELVKARISSKLTTDQPQFGFIDTMFVVVAGPQDYIAVYNPEVSDAFKRDLEGYLKGLLLNRQKPELGFRNRFITGIGGRECFFNILNNGNTYIGMCVSFDNMEIPMEHMSIGDTGMSLFVDSDSHALNHKDFIEKNHITLENDFSNYYVTRGENSYLVVGKKSSYGDFSLAALIPQKQLLGNLSYLNYFVLVMGVFILIMIMIFIAFLRKIVLNPFERITRVMGQIQNGNMDARITPFPASNEMSMVIGMFNHTMDQIKELKISVYENQISKQHEELEYLQLQIRPHFILNSLNIIHNLAQIKDYKLIQEMTYCLSEYFSYISRKKTAVVRFGDELNLIKNYLRIQELRFSHYFTYDIQVPEVYSEIPVPPLLIQTFVENTIKYALNMDDPVYLLIKAEPLDADGGEAIRITITNNGSSFREEILEHLRAGRRIVDERGEQHTGIWNIHRRLELIYGTRASMRFDNLSPQGVRIEIDLPVQP